MIRTTTPILSIFVAILIFMFFTHPQYVEVEDLKTEISEYQRATETYEDFSAKLGGKLAAKANRSAQEIERLNVLVPEDIDETQYLVDLEAMAEKNNMLFDILSVDEKALAVVGEAAEIAEEAPRDELMSMDIGFEVVGTYTQFKNFLRDLESSLTIYEVVNITLSAADGTFQRFKLTVRTYALPN